MYHILRTKYRFYEFNPEKAGLLGGSFFWGVGVNLTLPLRTTEPQMLLPWNFLGMLFKLLGLQKFKNCYQSYHNFFEHGLYVLYFNAHN